jgi:prepilin-type N-terminal cleavage/methylation domain-containing protein
MRHHKAFSLVELLVVIGIIALLIGILIPVVNQVRKAGYDASSKAVISALANAIERYHADHQAYPGPLGPDQLYNATVANGIPAAQVDPAGDTNVGGSGNAKISGTENLVLGLMGGLYRPAGGGIEYRAGDVGKGPLTLGANSKRRQSYIEGSAAVLSGGYFAYTDAIRSRDTAIPEFIDRFPDAMPILYLRARTGASGIVGRSSLSAPWTGLQYRLDDLLPYVMPNASAQSIGSPGFKRHGLRFIGGTSPDNNDGQNDTNARDAQPFLENTSLTGTPRRKDSFILIGAGADRIYGTDDDNQN